MNEVWSKYGVWVIVGAVLLLALASRKAGGGSGARLESKRLQRDGGH
jgi:hypothetical protein